MAKSVEVVLSVAASEPAVKAACRVFVSKDNLLQLTGNLESNRLCVVETLGDAPVRRQATLWPSPDPLKKTMARVSRAFCEAAGFGTSEKCRISVVGSVPEAGEVVVEDITQRDGLAPLLAEPEHVYGWMSRVADQLDLAEVVYPGMVVREVYYRRKRRSFRVQTVDGRDDNAARFVLDKTMARLPTSVLDETMARLPTSVLDETMARLPTSTVPVRTRGPRTPAAPGTASSSKAAVPKTPVRSTASPFSTDSPAPQTPSSSKRMQAALSATVPAQPPRAIRIGPIEGMEAVVKAMNASLRKLTKKQSFKRPHIPVTRSILIEGDAGTGKTMLMERVAAKSWGVVLRIGLGDKLVAIQETLQRAMQQQPSMVLIDNIQDLLTEERSNRSAVIQTLCDFLDQLNRHSQRNSDKSEGSSTEEEAGSPQILVVASCLNYFQMPEVLKRPGRLHEVVRIPFPDMAHRRAILRAFSLPLPPDEAEEMVQQWTLKTHAFNGHDLTYLLDKALTAMNARAEEMADQNDEDDEMEKQLCLTNQDLEHARSVVRPSCMGSIDIKPRPVYWHQVHGQDGLVRLLKQAVDMMNYPEKYERLISPIPRGYLLYGPPGCSKTMLAQALATESSLNYFAVKGGELLNQYVGQSEKNVRDLFARARSAAPSVIFLDEIDALGGRRGGPLGGESSARGSSGPQVVPALLSEMDGFEPLGKVLVLAATNQPDALDPALLRTGRFDRHAYVAPPSLLARRAMLQHWAARMDTSSDFDLDHLAAATEGYTGAEILNMCQTVGSSVSDLRLMSGPGLADTILITTERFQEAIQRTPKTVTADVLRYFDKWKPSM